MKILNPRLIVFLIAIVFGVIFSIPSFFHTQGPKINLGLDLQGGLNLLLGVEVEEAIKSRYSSIASSIDYATNQKSILLSGLQAQDDNVQFELIDSDDTKDLLTILEGMRGVKFDSSDNHYIITMTTQEQDEVRKQAIEQAISTIRNRLDQFGLGELSVTQQGKNNILVELPGVKSMQEEERIQDLISKVAFLQMMAVDEERVARVYEMSDFEAQKYNDVILEFAKTTKEAQIAQAQGREAKILLLSLIHI